MMTKSHQTESINKDRNFWKKEKKMNQIEILEFKDK